MGTFFETQCIVKVQSNDIILHSVQIGQNVNVYDVIASSNR